MRKKFVKKFDHEEKKIVDWFFEQKNHPCGKFAVFLNCNF